MHVRYVFLCFFSVFIVLVCSISCIHSSTPLPLVMCRNMDSTGEHITPYLFDVCKSKGDREKLGARTRTMTHYLRVADLRVPDFFAEREDDRDRDRPRRAFSAAWAAGRI